MENCTVRLAREVDLAALIRLFEQTLRRVCSRDYTPDQIDAWAARATSARWNELFASPLRFLVAEHAETIAGFASVDGSGHLHSLFVHPDRQRQGIASALLDAAESYAAAHGALKLTSEVSLTARPFFQRSGFRTLERQNAMIDGTCLVNYRMEKELNTSHLRFRRALPADRERILEIIGQAKAQMRAAGSLQWQDGYPAPENIRTDIARGYGYVICRKARVIAYGAVLFDGEPAYDEIDGAWLCDGPYAVVHRLAVADEAKGRGIAMLFMRRVESIGRENGMRSLRVDTNFDNHIMLRMLDTLGFVRCGEIRYRGSARIAFEKSV